MERFADADCMAMAMIADIEMYGEGSVSRGSGSRDMSCWGGVLEDPRARVVQNPARGLRTGYPAASVGWNLSLRNDVESISWWNEKGRKMSDDGKTFYGANYGQRLIAFLGEAMRLVEADPGTRRAWVPIWRHYDIVDDMNQAYYSRDGKDVPCTLGFGIRNDGGLLNMNVVMRSQSAWGVFPYDVYFFSVLQELIANQMGLELGTLGWQCVSLHYYDRERDWVRSGVQAFEEGFESVPMRPITVALDDALSAYAEAFDRSTMVDMPDQTGLPDDPVIDQMFEGAREIASSSVVPLVTNR